MRLRCRGAMTPCCLTPASPAGINALTPAVIRSFLGVLFRGFWRLPCA